MRRLLRSWVVAAVLVACLCVADAASAQGGAHETAQGGAGPTFEVATLKQVADSDAEFISIFPERKGDRFTWTMNLTNMMSYAYDIPWMRIVGVEPDGHFYAVTAKLDPSATEEQARQMLQALLVERLKLVAHRETREVQGYALVVGKNGPKLVTADASGEPPPQPPDMRGAPATAARGRIFSILPEKGVLSVVGRDVSMAQLADELSKDMKTAVVDRTGLTGRYYFDLRFDPSSNNPDFPMDADAPVGPVFSAVQDVGLKLEKQKVRVEYLVVEHAEKPAAE